MSETFTRNVAHCPETMWPSRSAETMPRSTAFATEKCDSRVRPGKAECDSGPKAQPGYANEWTFGPESHVGVGSVSERGMETNLVVRNAGYGKQANSSICPNLKKSDNFLPELRPLDCQSTGAAEFLGRS